VVSESRGPEDIAELRMLGDDVPMTDPAAKARAGSRLDLAIARERAAPARMFLRRWGTLAAAIVALSVATPLLLRGAADRQAPAPELLRLAAVASTQPAPSIPYGSFVYTRARVRATSTHISITSGEMESTVVVSRRETWVAQDGSGLIVERRITPASNQSERMKGGPGTFRFPNLDRLPTRPEALLEEISGPGFLDEPDDGFEVLSGIGALLRDSYVSPAHRQALFLIVEDMEGVEIESNYLDDLGRPAIAVSLRDTTQSVTLVFEPESSRLLAEFERRDDGAFVFEATYLETAVVRAVGERPAETGT
jgi:hypothetical protein